jgi:tetratricopeptide (TPR) repeat protein
MAVLGITVARRYVSERAFVLRANLIICIVLSAISVNAAENSRQLQADAKADIEKGEFASAENLLVRAKGIDPSNVEVKYQLAYVRYLRRELNTAKSDLLDLVKSAPPALHSRYLLGRIALLEGKPLDAVGWLIPAAGANPPIPDAAAQLAKAYFDANQIEKARELTVRAIALAPWDGALHYRLARILQQTDDAAKADAEFKESIRLKAADADSVEKLTECGRLLGEGKNTEAVTLRDGLIANDKLDPDVLLSVGVMLARAGLDAESVLAFRAAADRDPSLFPARFNEGLALLKTGHSVEAQTALFKSLQIVPQSVEANSAVALSYVMSEQYARAVPPLEFVYQREPENAKAAGLLGLSYLRSGAPSKSVAVLRPAVAARPADPKLYFLLIEALNATEDQPGALTIARDAARQFPLVAQAQLSLAQQLARMGRYAESGPSFEKTLQLEPRNLDAALGLGEIQNKMGEYGASLATYQGALALDHENEAAALGAARDLISLQRAAEARELLENTIAKHPADPQLHFELSRAYARLGEHEKAAQEVKLMNRLKAVSP